MLTLWSTSPKVKVLSVLRPVLRQLEDAPVGHIQATPDHRHVPQPGEVVLAMGGDALAALQAAGLVAKNRTIPAMRGKVVQAGAAEGRYLITYDPSLIDLDYSKQPEVMWDVRLAHRLDSTGSLEPVLGDYRWVEDFSELICEINGKAEATGKPVDVSFDTETMGLYPWYPKEKGIVALGFTCAEGKADCLYLLRGVADGPKVVEQLRWLLTSPRIKLKGSNLKFDLIWMAEHLGIECTNFAFDNTIVGSLLDENRSNSLNLHAKIYTSDLGGYDDGFNQKYDKGHMERIPKDALLPYLGGDVDASLRVSNVLRKDLLAENNGRLAQFYAKILHPAARVYEKIERRGLVVDVPKLQRLGQDLQVEITKLNKQALGLMPHRLRLKHIDNLSLDSGGLLLDYFFSPLGLGLKPKMFTEKTKAPSTAKAHFQMFGDVPEAKAFCEVLEALNSCKKMLSTYVTGFLADLRPDGRWHPTFMLFQGSMEGGAEEGGAVTGRRSAKNPAVQTVPKKSKWAKRIRECIVAPKGKAIIGADFSQAELRMVADRAGEQTMLAAYKQGLDLHAVTGAKLGGYSLEAFLALKHLDAELFDALRGKAKPANFGLCIAEGQLVLTPRGLVPIEKVDTADRVWDGEAWVSHEGVIFKGHKEVLTHDGLTATKDHEVWTADGRKVSLGVAASEGVRLARTGTEAGQPVVWDAVRGSGLPGPGGAVPNTGGGVLRLPEHDEGASGQSVVGEDQELPVPTEPEVRRRPPGRDARGEVRRHGPAMPEGHARVEPPVQGEGHSLLVPVEGGVHPLGSGDVAGFGLQGAGLRPGRQQRALRAGEPAVGQSVGEPEEQGVRRARVYDLLNAGPRHRFTCSGVLVSNCYGMGAEGFQFYCFAQYGLKLTLAEAAAVRDAFFELYPGLLGYYAQQKKLVRAQGFVTNVFGRVRHLPGIRSSDQAVRAKAERQAINSPIQGGIGEMMAWSLALLDQMYGEEVQAFCEIHDAGYFYVDEDRAEEWAGKITEVMGNLPFHEFGWAPSIPFPADAEWGPDLAHMKKL